MKIPLRILHLEDDPHDAALAQATLEAGGVICTITQVETRDNFVAALDGGGIDLILSDFTLPTFDGMSALRITREKYPALPLIFVSGTLGEERAIDSLKNGATDYVLKGRLGRLVPSVRRAMEDVEARIERQRLEAQFIEGQKMDVIGQLAGGVVHDFSNILAIIMGYSDMLTMKLGTDSPLQKYTEVIRHASQRAAGLTRQLLIFGRKETVQPVVLNLNDVVVDMEKMLRRLIDESIEMTITTSQHPHCITADSGYIGQVLMNLVVNARDAMPQGGKLTLSTRAVTLGQSEVGDHPAATPGKYVLLRVSDTGSGITDEVKAHMFEPFFTTKPVGKGTGLGLATCQTIIKLSGGWISVESKIGYGTTFNIYFPQVERPQHITPQPFQLGPLPRGTETVLVVEDEPAVRVLARSILEAQGYNVLSAANGQDALNTVREHKGTPIRLAFTDVIMPLMGGRALADWLKTTHPDLKILFTSGYADETILQHGVLETGVEFLPKPYTTAKLSCKVREMLDQQSTVPAGLS